MSAMPDIPQIGAGGVDLVSIVTENTPLAYVLGFLDVTNATGRVMHINTEITSGQAGLHLFLDDTSRVGDTSAQYFDTASINAFSSITIVNPTDAIYYFTLFTSQDSALNYTTAVEAEMLSMMFMLVFCCFHASS